MVWYMLCATATVSDFARALLSTEIDSVGCLTDTHSGSPHRQVPFGLSYTYTLLYTPPLVVQRPTLVA